MQTDTTRAPGAQPADAPAIPAFDRSNPAHQRAWLAALNIGRIEADRRAEEAAQTEEPDAEPANTSYALFYAYRRAKAAWELVQYSPEFLDEGVPDEINDPLFDAHTEALHTYLLTPADNLRDLARKLKVFRDEQIHDGWRMAQEVVEALAADGHRLAYSGDRNPEAYASPASR